MNRKDELPFLLLTTYITHDLLEFFLEMSDPKRSQPKPQKDLATLSDSKYWFCAIRSKIFDPHIIISDKLKLCICGQTFKTSYAGALHLGISKCIPESVSLTNEAGT